MHKKFSFIAAKARRFRYVLPLIALFASPLTAQPPDFTAHPASAELEEVIVTDQTLTVDLSAMTVETEKLTKVPGTIGDPLRAMFSLPGVTFASDSQSAPAVRGTAPGDNAYIIDFVPAAYVFHFLGDSIFNENLIHRFDLYPAAFGNEYSNATGAVIDVTLRDPKRDGFMATIDNSLIRTGALIESGIGENQGFYLSYRRSLIDQFYPEEEQEKVLDEEGIDINSLPVSDDYQLKYLWLPDPQQRLTLVLAGASDEVAATFLRNSNEALRDPDLLGPASLDESFDSQGVVYDWTAMDDNARFKTAISHVAEASKVKYGTGQSQDVDTEHLIWKTEYSRELNDIHMLTIGASLNNTEYSYLINAKIRPCDFFVPDCVTTDAVRFSLDDEITIRTQDYYIEDRWQFSETVALVPGVHYAYDNYLREKLIEPRIRSEWRLNPNLKITAAIGQYHQLPALEEIVPLIGNPELKSPKATHYVFGIERQLQSGWSWKTEIYYKKLYDLALSLGADQYDDAYKNYVNDASGDAYGAEVFINKNLTDRWYGWLSLSLARTERHNERTGETRPFDYDRPVMLTVVANYRWNDYWQAGFKWTVQSGLLYTPIVDVRHNDNNPEIIEPVYGELNSERLPLYHRLDVRIERQWLFDNSELTAYADVLNVYNQRNIEGYEFTPNGSNLESSTPPGFGGNVPVRADEGLSFFPSLGVKWAF